VLRTVWGEKRTNTVAKENGCSFELDLQKVFFCPRLAYERIRIAKRIKEGENVLVMFAGVGPYPITASKYSKAKNIVAIEINPDAFLFMQKNIEKNKCKNIEPILADVRDVLPQTRFEKWADRIIMPHPFSDTNFLALAIRALKPNGIIHYYSFENRHEGVEKIFEDAKKQSYNLADLVLLNSKKVRPICPNVYHYVLDMQVFHCACKPNKHFSQIP
jgi:tRNA (guanine37-N1)-methyltransferase